MAKKLILASASPRRRQLLKEAGIQFKAVKSNYDENNDDDLPPNELVLKHAIGKAKDVAVHIKDGVVLGADTIVVLGDEVIGKPKDDADAKKILNKLSGKSHKVVTGFVLLDAKTKKIAERIVTTDVVFKRISDADIVIYLQAGEHLDKAGAYAFQGEARKFIEKVVGSETNVIGLPMKEFMEEWKKFN